MTHTGEGRPLAGDGRKRRVGIDVVALYTVLEDGFLRISETRFKSPSLAIDYRMGIPTIKEETFDTQILCVKWPTYPQRANRPPNGPPSRFKYYIYLGRTTKQTFYRDVFMQCKYNGVVVFVTNIVIVSRRTV